MNRTITAAAATAMAVLALGACSRGDDTAYDTAAGTTAGAMATPPATPPVVGTSTGAVIGTSTGATTTVIDSTKKAPTKKP